MWALDASLAHQRHFPAVDWDTSFSLYADQVTPWFAEHGGADWASTRAALLALLQKERELRDISSLVGPEALEDRDHLTMDVAAIVREGVLRQSAYHPHDAVCAPSKTYALGTAALSLLKAGEAALAAGTPFAELDLVPARRAIAALRDAGEADVPVRAEEVRQAAAALTARRAKPVVTA
jgi:V/A-type H+-transporting ATPase subunit A